MMRPLVITLAWLLLGFPVTVGGVAALGMTAGLPPGQGLYLAMLFGPLLWAGLYAFVPWHACPVGENRKRTADE